MKTISNKKAYETLNKNHVHWDRSNKDHIIVYTNGYKTQDAAAIELYLNQAGMSLVEQNFDQVSGKTKSIFKHKAA